MRQFVSVLVAAAFTSMMALDCSSPDPGPDPPGCTSSKDCKGICSFCDDGVCADNCVSAR